MAASSPFAEVLGPDDAADVERLRQARQGSREALEALVARHQGWIYNIVRRMTYNPLDAEDATQEILIKLVTRLASFEHRSTFRTWLYRIVVNHVLNMKRGRSEALELTFVSYGHALEQTPDADLPDQHAVPADVQLVVEEAKTGCTSAMLLCLDREQRLVFILGEIFEVSSAVGAELLDISRDNFRQKLVRARRDLYNFLHGECGLVNSENRCRCAKKTQAFIDAGYVNPERLTFVTARVQRVQDLAGTARRVLESLDDQYAGIYREHPFFDSPDFVASLREVIRGPHAQSIVDGLP